MKSPIPDGRYTLARGGQVLVMNGGQSYAPIQIKYSSEREAQEWVIQTTTYDRVTLKNPRYNKYLGFDGAPSPSKLLIAKDKPSEFHVESIDGTGAYRLFVYSYGVRLYLDESPTRVYPPMSALVPAEASPNGWSFQLSR